MKKRPTIWFFVSLYVRVILLAAMAVFIGGILCPYLISFASTELVILGVIIALGSPIVFCLAIVDMVQKIRRVINEKD